MPIIYNKYSNVSLTFAYDPLVEMFASLHVISDSSHHIEWQNWVAQTVNGISPSLRNDIFSIGGQYNDFLYLMDVATAIAIQNQNASFDSSFQTALQHLEEMDDLDFSEIFLGFKAMHLDNGVLKTWLSTKEIGGSDDEKHILNQLNPFLPANCIEAYISDVAGVRREVVRIAKRYWNTVFHSIWSQISPIINKKINIQSDSYKKHGLKSYITSTFPNVKLEKENISVNREVLFYLKLDSATRFYIFMSAFTYPHTMLDVNDNNFILYYNVSFQSQLLYSEVPADVSALGKILSDNCRIKILRLLTERESTTSDLSDMLNLTKSTISSHLNMLKAAGFVNPRPDKKFVYYTTNKEAVVSALENLKEYIF